MYYDSTYVLVIIGFILTMFASFGVKHTFNKYSQIGNSRGMTAVEAARCILDNFGLTDVRIEHISGTLTDHYSPKEKVLRLSDSTINSTSVAAIGVAAHEAGHAIQHADGYTPIKMRNSIIPVVNFGSQLSMPVFLLGLFLGSYNLAVIGALLFGLTFAFQILTLPVEFNASIRALKILDESNMLYDEELKSAKKVLTAAALTYVASAAATLLQLIRLLMIAGRRNNRD